MQIANPATPQSTQPDTAAAPIDSLVTQPGDPAVSQLLRNLGQAQDMLAAGEYNLILDKGLDLAARFLPLFFSALFVGFLFWLGYRVFNPMLNRTLQKADGIDPGVRQLLLKTFTVVYAVLAAVMTLDQLGIQVTALLAGLSIAGIAIGFAARDTFENFIAGLTILLDQPFRVGDDIVIGDTFGTVREITLRSTRIQTLNDETVVVPNLQMINQQLTNHTLTEGLRVIVEFGIAYKEDTRQAREVVLGLTEGDDRLLEGKEPTVVTDAMADSSVNMQLRLWIEDPRKLREVRFEYTEQIFLALKEAGIEIPYPHRTLFLDGADAFADAPFMHGGDGSPPEGESARTTK